MQILILKSPLKHLRKCISKLCLRSSRARDCTIVQSSQIVLGTVLFFFKIVPSIRLTLAFLRLSHVGSSFPSFFPWDPWKRFQSVFHYL